ncbi:MAG TPA: ferrous iron transport protein B [Limnochordales bacterium]
MGCHVTTQAPPVDTEQRPVVVALVGNPNVGKSSLFNALTGLHQRVGNWPGKTVERREGLLELAGRTAVVVDLPGSYSLESYTLEESVTRQFLLQEKPDLIVNVVDVLHLERNLYLTSQLLELGIPMVVALTMGDMARARGVEVDVDALARRLGVPAVPVVGATGEGLDVLRRTLASAIADGLQAPPPPVYPDPTLEELVASLAGRIPSDRPGAGRRLALALIQQDPEAIREIEAILSETEREHLLRAVEAAAPDGPVRVADARYAWVASVVREALRERVADRPPRGMHASLADRVDLIVTHPVVGPPLTAATLAAGIWAAFRAAGPVQDWLDGFFAWLSGSVTGVLGDRVAPWAVALLTDGLMAGVATVALFAPLIAAFFLFLGLLEDSGYFARAAFVLDRLLSRFGLQGKAGIGLFIGYGCNVPAVMAARTASSTTSRLISVLVSPLVICSARLVVIGFMAGVFFPGGGAAWVMVGLYGLGLALVLLVAWLLSRTALRGDEEPFLIELPPYRLPRMRNVALYAWHQTAHFLQRAVTVIAPMTAVVWAIAYFPSGSVESSLAAGLGHLLEPLGRPLGFDWRLIVSLFPGFLAKEASLPAMAVLYASGSEQGLGAALRAALTVPQALSYLVFYTFYTPCLATAVTIYQETGSTRWTLVAVGYSLLLAGVLAWGVHWGALHLWAA